MKESYFTQGEDTPISCIVDDQNDRLLTPANLMTAERLILALNIAEMIVNEEHPISPYAIGMAITDMDGKVARFFDRHFSELRLGTTNLGAIADPIVDTASIIIISSAALSSPRISIPGKIAIITILGQEGLKSAWGLKSAYNYKNLTKSENNIHGDKLIIPVLSKGKKAMASKLVSLVCAIATNDFDDPKIRRYLGITALATAGFGSYQGETTRRIYAEQYKEIIHQFQQ